MAAWLRGCKHYIFSLGFKRGNTAKSRSSTSCGWQSELLVLALGFTSHRQPNALLLRRSSRGARGTHPATEHRARGCSARNNLHGLFHKSWSRANVCSSNGCALLSEQMHRSIDVSLSEESLSAKGNFGKKRRESKLVEVCSRIDVFWSSSNAGYREWKLKNMLAPPLHCCYALLVSSFSLSLSLSVFLSLSLSLSFSFFFLIPFALRL